MKCIPLASLNPSRLQLLIEDYLIQRAGGEGFEGRGSRELQGGQENSGSREPSPAGLGLDLPSPAQLAIRDPAVYLPGVLPDAR